MGFSITNPTTWDDAVSDAVEEFTNEAVNAFEDNVVDPLVDAANDAVNYFEDNVVDPFSDQLDDIESNIKDTLEGIEDFYEDMEHSLNEFLEDIEEFGDAIIAAGGDALEWLEDSLDSAADWLLSAAEKVYEFIVEEAIPYMVAVAEALPAISRALGALVALPFCLLFKELFGDEEATILEGVAKHEPRLLNEFDIERLPVNKKYIVFSDVHMYVDGDLNFFNDKGNAEIYQHALKEYAQNDYHLIENGDVEDFWMRGGSSKALVLNMSESLPWPFYSESFDASAFQSANQVHALNMFINNSETYSTIKNLFHDNNKYTKLIGNHDDVWSDTIMKLMIGLLYPGITVNDYCTLENFQSNETEVIIAHGHQSDMFNMSMCSFAGKELTKVASVLHELSFGKFNKFTKSKEKWMNEFTGNGFENKLQETDLLDFQSFDENSLRKDLESIYGDSNTQPYLILGHTHNPKDDALIPQGHSYWGEYSNSGTVGMWEGIVIGLEVEYPRVDVIAWKKEQNGTIKKHILQSHTNYGSYLK